MRIDGQSPLEWGKINKRVQEALGCESKIYVYRGLHQALFEICLGLHLRFGHKRKIVAEIGLGDHLKNTEVELAKLGVRFKNEFEGEVAQEEKATLTYIHDLDDAITAELYDHIETLKKLSSSKIYRIHVAHHLFHIKKTFIQKLSEYDIIICALNQEYALVFTGDKVFLPTLTVGQLVWDSEKEGDKIINLVAKDQGTYQSKIVAFESSLPQGVKPWFVTQPAKRIYDRAVIILSEHDGSAMMEILAQNLDLKLSAPGKENLLESASYCRWSNDSWFEQAEKMGRSQNDLRGTLIIDGSIIDDHFIGQFAESLRKLNDLAQ